jgi:hypothetical protein
MIENVSKLFCYGRWLFIINSWDIIASRWLDAETGWFNQILILLHLT